MEKINLNSSISEDESEATATEQEQEQEEEEVVVRAEKPKERKKRALTKKQRDALAKARVVKQLKNQKKTTMEFSTSYILGTAVIGLGGLALFYYMNVPKNYKNLQENLLTEIKKAIPKEFVLAQPQPPPSSTPQSTPLLPPPQPQQTQQQQQQEVKKPSRLDRMFS